MIDVKVAAAARALAMHKSFRVAAEVTGTSPSSFSRYIRQAEEYAGQQLFERRGTGVVLTPAGQIFMSLLDSLQEAVGQFRAGAERLRLAGPDIINIGCGPLAARSIVGPLISDMMQAHPEMRSMIKVTSSKEPLESLRTGELDIAICDLTHTPDLNDLEIVLLKKRSASFWARPQHPIHKKTQVHIQDVFRSHLAAPYLPIYWRQQIANVLGGGSDANQRVMRIPHVESDDVSMLAEIAVNTDLICGGMSEDFQRYKRLGLLKEIQTIEAMNWNICMARRNETSFPSLERMWSSVLSEYVI